ncbi:hypothetical protein DCE93_00970 [Agromyces badenianii]|uniref:Uncharacterized protein n=1 Tax=Agromyces badenianii TaxID=2080742 RepID=A0A2S0WSZ9_9MICO|nr:hypothetical protein [Agromyces badenianii]AWB94418.1 hypothetical protein DCE93_00970 [Agromyces badenianii]PWC05782.1 hypothetical protein DCE94_05955 [Agromyces badenianii]
MATTIRTQRAEAKRAIGHAKHAEAEARKLVKTLPQGPARSRLDGLVAEAHATRKAAEAERKVDPRLAARRAAHAATKLERASLRVAPGGARRAQRAAPANATGAEQRAKARAKTLKRRRKQAKSAQKMAKAVARRTIMASISTPTDEKRRKVDAKRARPQGVH